MRNNWTATFKRAGFPPQKRFESDKARVIRWDADSVIFVVVLKRSTDLKELEQKLGIKVQKDVPLHKDDVMLFFTSADNG